MTQNDALDWRKLFHEVLIETDAKKLQEKIDAVEGAIFFRYQELERSPDAESERSAIQEATQVITTLKAQKLSVSMRSGVWAGAPKH